MSDNWKLCVGRLQTGLHTVARSHASNKTQQFQGHWLHYVFRKPPLERHVLSNVNDVVKAGVALIFFTHNI